MVKCLECGFEGPRLQWTHFKYKCTGRFANGREYMLAHPGAKVVSEDLAKTTAVTLSNLIKKYGEVDGTARWESYREKQSYTNSFEYKRSKYGWSESDFAKYNSSRSQTLSKMIERHGESTGAAMWEKYCLRQAYTNTKDYFISKYGVDDGTKKYLEINRKKLLPHNPELLAEHLSISIDDAASIIISRQKNFFISKLEKEFTTLLSNVIGPLECTSDKNPFGKWSPLLNTYVVFDIKHKNCIIEFNGNYWHANPKIYKDTAPIRGVTANDIWRRDQLKMQTVKNLGFSVLTVWEDEFTADKIGTIERVKTWILQNQ